MQAPRTGRRTFGVWLSDRWADPGQRRVTIGWILFVASLVVYYLVAGIPWSTNSVLLYVVAGLVISSLGSGVRWKRLILDWLPLIAVLFGYGILRGYASHTFWGQQSSAERELRAGLLLTAGVVRHTRLQRRPDGAVAALAVHPGTALLGLSRVGLLHEPLLHVVHHRRGPVEDELPQVPPLRASLRRTHLRRLHHLRALSGHAAVDGQRSSGTSPPRPGSSIRSGPTSISGWDNPSSPAAANSTTTWRPCPPSTARTPC